MTAAGFARWGGLTAIGFARWGGLTAIGFAAAAVVGLTLWFTGAECPKLTTPRRIWPNG
jgi:hypothetical protein